MSTPDSRVQDREDAFRRTSEDRGSALRCAPLCLHESGSDDARARDDRTPLHVAAAQRSGDTVVVLLDADGTARTVDGKTPFDLAEGLRGTDAYRRLRDALIR